MIDDTLAQSILDDMLRIFGTLPHPEHEPKRLLALFKIYKHIKTDKK
jgi:hypothetical protein